MAIRYYKSFYARKAGVWVTATSAAAMIHVRQSGAWWKAWKIYRKVGGSWVHIATTSKYAPDAAPSSVYVSHVDKPLLRNDIYANFTVAGGMPLPEAAYELVLDYVNITSPGESAIVVLPAGSGHTSPQLVGGANDDDDVYIRLYYREAGEAFPFEGPTAQTATYTVT